jgi:hypothetical protein
MKTLRETYFKENLEQHVLYHGTSRDAGFSILKNGFSLRNVGSRQASLYGKASPLEVEGIYLTTKDRAKWYAEPKGIIIEVKVNGKIMPEKEWWKLNREISNRIGGGVYDDEKNRQKKEEAVTQAKKLGYIGIVENTEPDYEVIIFNPKNIEVVGELDTE